MQCLVCDYAILLLISCPFGIIQAQIACHLYQIYVLVIKISFSCTVIFHLRKALILSHFGNFRNRFRAFGTVLHSYYS